MNPARRRPRPGSLDVLRCVCLSFLKYGIFKVLCRDLKVMPRLSPIYHDRAPSRVHVPDTKIVCWRPDSETHIAATTQVAWPYFEGT